MSRNIALIFGGPSAEHDVSLISAKCIFEVLQKSSFNTYLLGITHDRQWKLIKPEDLLNGSFQSPLNIKKCGTSISIKKMDDSVIIVNEDNQSVFPIDVAFPIIHGPYGEDGQLQEELNQLGLPYVGSDAESCKVSFDKQKTKEAISKTGIQQVPYLYFSDQTPTFEQVVERLGKTVFVKPASMGSSIGISKVTNAEEYDKALSEAYAHDSKIIIEKGLAARELECALIENPDLRVSGLGEVKPKHDFYSYEAKYLDPDGAELIIPARVDEKIASQMSTAALECFKALGCRDYARADFFLDHHGQLFFNEINTHPGFTTISQFPMLWEEQGMTYQEIIAVLIENALKRSVDK